jgi:hypothetical protein
VSTSSRESDVDPYLRWSELGRWAGHDSAAGDGWVPLLVQADAARHPAFGNLASPPWSDGAGGLFFTARVPVSQVLPHAARARRVEFGLAQPSIAAPARRRSVARASAGAGAGRVQPMAGLVLAVVDRGCALLQRAFRDGPGSRTRLLGVWEQGRAAARAPWVVPAGLGYGRELDRAAIDALLARATPTGAGEAALYRDLDMLLDAGGRLRGAAHGTHVLDVMAGRHPVARSPGAGPAPADATSERPLVFVDVPAPGPRDTTGASGGAYLLDALRYIRLRAGAGVPVLVNISLGALAGPHDGSSLTEQAIDAFLDADRAMAVTVAAGNAGLERWHVRGTLRRGQPVTLGWHLRPDDPTDSFAELWFDTDAATAATTVRLDSPDGRHAELTLPAGAAATGGEALIGGTGSTSGGATGGAPVAALLARPAGAVGRGAMVLVAVGPCAGTRATARHGLWRITVASSGDVPIAAWVQRDEPVWEGGTPVQSWLDVVQGDARVSREGSVSNLASGCRTVVVGAAGLDGRAARYSSRPVPGGRRIDALAQADDNAGVGGLVAAGVLSGTRHRMGGTSVAAPSAAREIARRLLDGRITVPAGGSLADAVRQHVATLPCGGDGIPLLDGRAATTSRAAA